jgi:hypothetical protein
MDNITSTIVMNSTSVVMNSTTILTTTPLVESTTSKYDKIHAENAIALCVMLGIMCLSMSGCIIYANVRNTNTNTVKTNTSNDKKDNTKCENDKGENDKGENECYSLHSQSIQLYVQSTDISQNKTLPFVITGNHDDSDYISVKSISSVNNDTNETIIYNDINNNQDTNSGDYLLEDVVVKK